MSKEEQKPNIYQIPKNSFDTGYVLNGQFKTRNFVEGIILALPFLGIFIYGWHDLGWDVQSTVAYCAILCAAAFLGAAHGVGGDSLFEFIQRVIRFRQSRRISKYNPRIKTELEPEYLIHDGRMLPKDKLKQMLGTVKGKVLGEENGPISSDITDEELKVFYDDDYGFLEKPDALKSKAELRAEAKQRAKEEKEYINSLPRSERKAAREEIKRKREREEAEKKAAAPADESNVDFTHEAEISYDDFCKVELRVAEVRACENLKESKKLLHLTVFDGERERCILSGIAKWFKPEDLIGKKIGIVCNLAPRPMMKGKYVSEGMIFAADTADGGCSIAFYGDDTPVGSRIH